jgi:hypothetical protein
MRVRSQLQLENTDPLLRPFLQAEDESEAQSLLAQLIEEHAQPLVRDITRSKLHVARFAAIDDSSSQEAHDVCGEVALQLLSRLRDLRDDREPTPIGNFQGYVAAVTYNACTVSLRRNYPERQRLEEPSALCLASRFALCQLGRTIKLGQSLHLRFSARKRTERITLARSFTAFRRRFWRGRVCHGKYAKLRVLGRFSLAHHGQ